MKSPLRPLLVCVFLFVLPLLMANIYYIDDNGRAAFGYTHWGPDGRPLADIMVKALFLSSHIADIFPLPLILAVVLLSVSLVKFSSHFLNNYRMSYAVLVALIFFCNPYLAEVFSYRFDVLTLSAALSLSLLYCSVMVGQRSWIRFAIGTLIIVAIYCLYQTVINIAAIMVIASLYYQMNSREPAKVIFITLLKRLGELISGTLIYMKLILPATFSGKVEVNHPTLAGSDLISTAINNLHIYSQFINDTLLKGQGGIRFLVLLLAVASIASVVVSLRYLRQNREPMAIIICIGAVIAPFVAILMIPGSLLLLQNPLLSPRSLVGLSGFTLLTALLLAIALPERLKMLTWVLLIPIMHSLVFYYAYGNSLREQSKFNDNLVRQIKSDTRALNYNSVYFIYSGEAPRSPVYENAAQNYPVLSFLVPNYFSNWYWPEGNMRMNGLQQPWVAPDAGVDSDISHYICQTAVFASNQDYKMWMKGNVIVIDFNRTHCP